MWEMLLYGAKSEHEKLGSNQRGLMKFCNLYTLKWKQALSTLSKMKTFESEIPSKMRNAVEKFQEAQHLICINLFDLMLYILQS